MNRAEFLQRLEAGLTGVSPDERVAALQYYTEYFDDAGPEREAEVLKELGDPIRLAADIRAASGAEELPLHTQTPEQAVATAPPSFEGQAVPGQPRPGNWNGTPLPGGYVPQVQPVPPPSAAAQAGNSTGRVLGWVLLLIFLSPLLLALAGVAFGLAVSVALVLAIPLILGFAFALAGLLSAALSFIILPVAVGHGLVVMGTSLCMLGGGILLLWAGIKIFTRVIPGLFRGIAGAIRSLLPKNRRGGVSHG